MTMPTKKVLLPMAALAVIGAAGFGVHQVSAASSTSGSKDSLVQKIADTFNLDKAKVQAVFDADHASREAERETAYEARLTKAVTDGQLTEAQKTLILAKHKELVAARDAAHDSSNNQTAAERKAAMDKERSDLEAWAKANNIDIKWLMGGGPGMGGRGGHGMGMMGPDSDDAPAASPSASPAS